jgi:hypothetical protein
MEMPIGDIVQENLKTAEMNISETITKLAQQGFTGYMVATVEGYSGMEEGMLLFRKGEVVGAGFEYMRIGKEFFGDDALPLVLNSFKAVHGIVDIFALTSQQLDLVTSFQEKVNLRRKYSIKDVLKMIPKQYSVEHAKMVVSQFERKEEKKLTLYHEIGLLKD